MVYLSQRLIHDLIDANCAQNHIKTRNEHQKQKTFIALKARPN